MITRKSFDRITVNLVPYPALVAISHFGGGPAPGNVFVAKIPGVGELCLGEFANNSFFFMGGFFNTLIKLVTGSVRDLGLTEFLDGRSSGCIKNLFFLRFSSVWVGGLPQRCGENDGESQQTINVNHSHSEPLTTGTGNYFIPNYSCQTAWELTRLNLFIEGPSKDASRGLF